jgi:formate dehydrogenase major subunit
MVSLLKEYFGEHATAENDFGFDLLPKIDADHGTYRTVMDMVDGGKVFGYFLLGQNPAVGSAHGKLQRLGMANLDWVVVRDLGHDRERHVLEGLPEIETGRDLPGRAGPEVFFFPAASHVEKEARSPRPSGCCSGATKAVEPDRRPALGAARSSTTWAPDREERPGRGRPTRATSPVQKLDWSYQGLRAGPSRRPEDVLRRINGYRTSPPAGR